MREIKFRAWDKIKEKMVTDGFYIRPWNGSLMSGIELREELELMQYTGLHDKNGKEIYEGDVVLVPDTYTETVDVGVGSIPVAQEADNHLARVSFTNGSFVFIITENADVLSKGEYTYGQLEEEVGIEELEVIGNIYENPDLIK